MGNELPKADSLEDGHSRLIATLQSSLEAPDSVGNQEAALDRAYSFKVANINFIIEQGLYCELISGFKVSALPNAPDHFLGLANIRGNLLPIYQIESFIDGATPSKPSSAIILGHPQHGAAIVIKDKPEPINLSSLMAVQSEANLDLPLFLRASVTKTLRKGDQVWHQIDHIKLFNYLAQLI